MKKIIIAGILLIALAGGAIWAYRHFHRAQSSDLTLYGNVDIRDVQMGFRQSGRLLSMAYDEGDTVTAGDELARLDAQPAQQAVAVAEADVALAQAQFDAVQSGSRPLEIAQAQDVVQQREIAQRNATLEFERAEKLQATASIARAGLDDARFAREAQAAQLSAAEHALALAKEGPRAEDRAASAARLRSAQARLAQAQTALADTRLTAPTAAVVQVRIQEPGSMVGVSEPVYTLSLTDRIYVRAYASETELPRMVPGAAVTLSADGALTADGAAKIYHGTVGFISPRAEFTPKSVETPDLRTDLVYRLRILVSDADTGLRQGMPVTITVHAPQENG